MIEKLGALKSINFKRVTPQGFDTYDVAFAHGQVEWLIAPLAPDGKVTARGYHELP